MSYAVLAPSPHNMQPWLALITGPNRLRLFCNPEKMLPETDPFHRQITIALGCFIRLFEIATAELGYHSRVELFPDGVDEHALDDRAIADIIVSPPLQKHESFHFVTEDNHGTLQRHSGFSFVTVPSDKPVSKYPLFSLIPKRHTSREVYDRSRAITADEVTALLLYASRSRAAASVDSKLIALLRDLTWRAHLIETATPRVQRENIALTRIGNSEIDQMPDGIDMGGTLFNTLDNIGLLSREQLSDPASIVHQRELEKTRRVLHSAMGYVWLRTDANTRVEQIEAGRDYVAVNLVAAALGLSIQPLSQGLQESPEMQELHNELHSLLTDNSSERIQMLARLGYSLHGTRPSPRWPVRAKVL